MRLCDLLGPVLAHVHAKTWELHDKLHCTVQSDQLHKYSTAKITTVPISSFSHTVRGVMIMPIAERVEGFAPL